MIYFWIILAVFMILSGVYMVHLSDRSTSLIKRLGSIVLTMFGSYLLWFIAAVHIAPVHQISVKVEAELKDGLVLSFVASSSRSCKIEKLDVFLVSPKGERVPVNSKFIYSSKTGSDDIGFIFVENPSNYDVDKISLNVTHFCPFGFEVETSLKDMRIRSTVSESPPKP